MKDNNLHIVITYPDGMTVTTESTEPGRQEDLKSSMKAFSIDCLELSGFPVVVEKLDGASFEIITAATKYRIEKLEALLEEASHATDDEELAIRIDRLLGH